MFSIVHLHYFWGLFGGFFFRKDVTWELVKANSVTNTETHLFAIFHILVSFFFMQLVQHYKLLLYTFRANLSMANLHEQAS